MKKDQQSSLNVIYIMYLHIGDFTGNLTPRQYTEKYYGENGLYKVGPNHGISLCHTKVFRSGPDYLIMEDCNQFKKGKTGHMENVSILQ